MHSIIPEQLKNAGGHINRNKRYAHAILHLPECFDRPGRDIPVREFIRFDLGEECVEFQKGENQGEAGNEQKKSYQPSGHAFTGFVKRFRGHKRIIARR